MKAKSMKMRFLITLYVLFKYSDKDHRLNSAKINKFLKPYNLDCKSRAINDTVSVLREFGIDVQSKGSWDNQGIWIEDKLLPDELIQQLVYAVSTNPHITKQKANEILKKLIPLATDYQISALAATVETDNALTDETHLSPIYFVITEAIRENRRILYSVEDIRYNKEKQGLYKRHQWDTLFTPKCIYQAKTKKLYMVGYNHPDDCIQAIPLSEIVNAKISFKHHHPKEKEITQLLKEVDPKDYIPEEQKEIIYEGPAVFRCRGQYLGLMYHTFGEPSEPIRKDERGRILYAVQNATICPKTLSDLHTKAKGGFRIKGPETLRNAVQDYYEGVARRLLDARLLPDLNG